MGFPTLGRQDVGIAAANRAIEACGIAPTGTPLGWYSLAGCVAGEGIHSMSMPYKYDSEVGQSAVKKAANTRGWLTAQMTTGAAIAMMVVAIVVAWWYLTS